MNKDFWNRILVNLKNISIKILNWILDLYKNHFLPVSKKLFNLTIEKTKNFYKKLSTLISDFYKNRFLPFSKKLINLAKEKSVFIPKKILNWISYFYKNQFLPFLKKSINSLKEFYRLSLLNIKEDSKELLDKIFDSFIGLSVYYGEAGNRIKIFFSKWKNVVNHIKYLSYRRLILYTIIFLVLDITLIWFSTYRILYAKHYWEGGQDIKFFIRPGKNLDEIIDDLKEKNILKSKLIFKIYVKISGKENLIISRRYLFNSGISNNELLNILTDRNMVQMEKFTLIEGLRIKQIARIVENKLQLSQDRFIRESENDSLINLLGLKGKIKNLEGFLFPDTYFLPLDVDEKELVNILFNEFRKKVLNNNDINSSIESKNENLLDVIILASIIQGETNLKEEMPIISGVYHNRLEKKMKLEADPTVQYALPDGPKPKLKYSDLKIDSPYNTYKYSGLPPSPINNPGLYAIKAAIEPDKNKYLFFVATGNGGHRFSETYSEHLKAIEEYKKNTEKNNDR